MLRELGVGGTARWTWYLALLKRMALYALKNEFFTDGFYIVLRSVV